MHIGSDGRDYLYYEDSQCKVKVSVADFRDPCWWLRIVQSSDKDGNAITLNSVQKIEIYKRISARFKSNVYVDKIGFVSEDLKNIDENRSVMEME